MALIDTLAAIVKPAVDTIAPVVEAPVDSVAAMVQASVDTVTAPVESAVDTIAFTIQAFRQAIVSCIRSPVRAAIKTLINAIALSIQAFVDTITATVQAFIDAVAAAVETFVDAIPALVETPFDAFAARFNAIGNSILSQCGVSQQHQAATQQTEFRCFPCIPRFHVFTPSDQCIVGSCQYNAAHTPGLTTIREFFRIIVKFACRQPIWQARNSRNKDDTWPWQSPPPAASTENFAGSGFA